MISKTGAINKASERLGITQPALTRRIQKLEKQFGLHLLERQSKGVKLTEIGERFLLSSQRLLAHSKDFEAEMKSHQLGRGNTIKIGIKPGLDDLFFRESLLEFNKKFPETVVRVYSDATPRLMRQLRNGELDIAFGALGYADDSGNETIISQELSFSPLMQIPLIAYLGKHHPALESENVMETLFNYPLISPTPPFKILKAIEAAYKAQKSNYLVPQILIDDFNFAAKIVKQSHYWSAIYEPLYNDLSKHGEFISLGRHDILPP